MTAVHIAKRGQCLPKKVLGSASVAALMIIPKLEIPDGCAITDSHPFPFPTGCLFDQHLTENPLKSQEKGKGSARPQPETVSAFKRLPLDGPSNPPSATGT